MTDMVLAKLDQARLLLSEARTVQETKQIMDIAEAARAYAKQANLSAEAVNYAAEIKVRAERRLGEMLETNGRKPGQSDRWGKGATEEPLPPKLADLGITKKQSARAQRLATIPEETKDLAIHFIAYAYLDTRQAYLLPWALLRDAWRMNKQSWIAWGELEQNGCRKVVTRNRKYNTVSVAVPITVVYRAIGEAAQAAIRFVDLRTKDPT